MTILRHFFLLLIAAAVSHVKAYDVVSLDLDNYVKETKNKTVFIRYYAPWVSVV
jgi:hypothetical protein